MEQGAQLGVDSLQRHLLALVFARLQVMKGTCTMLGSCPRSQVEEKDTKITKVIIIMEALGGLHSSAVARAKQLFFSFGKVQGS